MTHLFGPVPSRRLGRSLGVDLIPRKTCPYDCVYCEVGPTTRRTLRRFPHQAENILREVADYLKEAAGEADFITLAGSGEPTLNQDLGRLISAIKSMTAIPVAVLTNGALLHLTEVRRDLAAADVVLPSLDAAIEETWRAVNRPLPGLTLDLLLEGLTAFRREYAGQIWLEILLLKGINDTEEELAALSRVLRDLAPDKVQLNTQVRPGVEDWARALAREELAAAAAALGPGVEVIASFNGGPPPSPAPGDADFLAMLARRPMTAADLARALGLALPEVKERLRRLLAAGRLSRDLYREQEFYRHKSLGR
jgi:wyosine [tRNA(Phe)-imidazoG37] synthetase (radical SAM superfamily)